VLAALGLAVIIATVWVQRNRAMLVARFGGMSTDGRPSFPGGVGMILLPIVAAMLQLPGAAALDAAERRGTLAQAKRAAIVARRQAAVAADSARLDSLRPAAPRERDTETPPRRAP
jgi:hypothetical protein